MGVEKICQRCSGTRREPGNVGPCILCAEPGCGCGSKACPDCMDTYTRAHVDELSDQVMKLTAERDKKAEFIEGLMEELGQVRELHGADMELLDEARADRDAFRDSLAKMRAAVMLPNTAGKAAVQTIERAKNDELRAEVERLKVCCQVKDEELDERQEIIDHLTEMVDKAGLT